MCQHCFLSFFFLKLLNSWLVLHLNRAIPQNRAVSTCTIAATLQCMAGKEEISEVLVEESATVLPIELLIGGREGRSSQVPQILSSRLTNCCVHARPCVSAIKTARCNYNKKKKELSQ